MVAQGNSGLSNDRSMAYQGPRSSEARKADDLPCRSALSPRAAALYSARVCSRAATGKPQRSASSAGVRPRLQLNSMLISAGMRWKFHTLPGPICAKA
ncbi:hypothetical protein D3C84_937130 [compost metagenome]